MAATGNISRAGDAVGDATHDLYRRYGRQIYAYCLHKLRSREEAEDAVQTTFLNAFRGLQRGNTAEFEQAWLFKIAHNVCIARQTSSSRRLRLEAAVDFDVVEEVVPAAGASGDSLELIGLSEALEQMPEKQRQAILLREWQGLSYREIGERLELSQAAVEMLIFRARRGLANALEQPAEGRRARKVGSGLSLGSLLAAAKSLLGGSAAIKAVAVAAAAFAVASSEAAHTIVHHARSTAGRKASAPLVVPVRHSAGTGVARGSGAVAASGSAPAAAAVHPVRSGPSLFAAALHASAPAHVHAAGGGTTAAPAPVAPAPPEAPLTPVAAPAPAPSAPPEPPHPAPPAPPAQQQTQPQPQAPSQPAAGIGRGKQKDHGNDDRTPASAPPPAAPPTTTTTSTTTTPSTTSTTTTATTSTTPAPPAPQGDDNANGKDHGHGHGHDSQQQQPAPVATTPAPGPTVTAPPAPVQTMPAASQGGDNGNGHGNGRGDHGHGH